MGAFIPHTIRALPNPSGNHCQQALEWPRGAAQASKGRITKDKLSNYRTK